jgi:hypothetical protein
MNTLLLVLLVFIINVSLFLKMKRVKKEVVIISLVIIGVIVTYKLKEGFQSTSSTSGATSSSTSGPTTAPVPTCTSLAGGQQHLRCEDYDGKLTAAQIKEIDDGNGEDKEKEKENKLNELNGNTCPYAPGQSNWCPKRPCYMNRRDFSCISQDEYDTLAKTMTNDNEHEQFDYIGDSARRGGGPSDFVCTGCECSIDQPEGTVEVGGVPKIPSMIKWVIDKLFKKYDNDGKVIPNTGVDVGYVQTPCPEKCAIGKKCPVGRICDKDNVKPLPEDIVTSASSSNGSIIQSTKGQCNKQDNVLCKRLTVGGICQSVAGGCLRTCSKDCLECDEDYVAPTTAASEAAAAAAAAAAAVAAAGGTTAAGDTSASEQTQDAINKLMTAVTTLTRLLNNLKQLSLDRQKSMTDNLEAFMEQLKALRNYETGMNSRMNILEAKIKRLIENPVQPSRVTQLTSSQFSQLVRNFDAIYRELLKIQLIMHQNKTRHRLYSRATGAPQENNISKYFRGSDNKDIVYNVGVPLRNYMSQIIRPENWNKKLNPPVCLDTGVHLNKPVSLVSDGASGAYQFQGVGTILPKFAYTEEYDAQFYS